MHTRTQSLMALTAEDLMTRDVVPLSEKMSLRDASRLMLRKRIGGAPVVDTRGRCIGVLSAFDFLRLAGNREDASKLASPPLPITCPFQGEATGPHGEEVVTCTLSPGVCPIQAKHEGMDGEELIVCSQPRCVLVDWQVVDVEKLPTDEVRRFMTPDPVTARPATPIRGLARMMIDAHIHRIIVVNEERHPIGIVSSTDLLAAVAYAEDEE